MGLKVFDLQCDNGHLFEGWFGSHEDYDSQDARGLITCPVCQSGSVVKRLSAPHLNMGHANDSQATPPAHAAGSGKRELVTASPESGQLAQLQAAILQQMREFIRKTENVGDQFADEARRIHEGSADERPIRGVATHEEREALAEEGIAVVALTTRFDVSL